MQKTNGMYCTTSESKIEPTAELVSKRNLVAQLGGQRSEGQVALVLRNGLPIRFLWNSIHPNR
jgi:hypothetical protein